MKLLWTWGALAILAARVVAQDATAPASAPGNSVEAAPVPFLPNALTESDLENASELSDRGRQALQDGISSEAVSCFQRALAIPNLDTATKDGLNLDLVTAYLSENQLDQAAAALQSVMATDSPAYLLRAALLQSRKGHWDGADGASALLARIDSNKLSSSDLPWYYAVQARLAEYQGNADAARSAWQQAVDHAPALLQGQFQAALSDSQILLSKVPTADEVEKLHANIGTASTPALGAHFASLYAIGKDQLGQHQAALDIVTDWISHRDLDPKNRDMLRLLMVYLDGKGPPQADPTLDPQAVVGRDRQALEDILQEPIDVNSPDRDNIRQMQSQALSLLEQQSLTEKSDGTPTVSDAAGLEKFIDSIIADQDPDSHPLLEQLYQVKAHLAMLLNQTDVAEATAKLLEKYPSSLTNDPAIIDADMILAQIYWRGGQPDGQPRLAADYLLKVYNGLAPDLQAPIARSLAYMYFVSGDYHDAAEFYTRLFKNPEPNSPISRGELLFRAVQSELQAGSMDAAVKLMDDPAIVVDLTADERWRAEYTLLLELRKNNPDAAFQRLNRLIDPNLGANLLKRDLYLRLLWLNADLAVARRDANAGQSVDVLQKTVETLDPATVPGLTTEERTKLADLCAELDASAMLLAGDAVFLAKPADAAGQAAQFDEQHKIFETLRQKFPESASAQQSYLDEAAELETQNKFTEAQRLYNTLVDKFPKSDFAPWALYNSALDAIQTHKADDKYAEAFNLLAKFVANYVGSDTQPPLFYLASQPLIYRVQLKQADLERELNEVPKDKSLENAADLYALLIKKYPNDPLTPEAKVSWATCLRDLATLPDADPQRRTDAIDELEVLYNQTSLPAEDRANIGFMWGNLLQYATTPNHSADAVDVFYRVKKDILDNDQARTELDNSPNGRPTMIRCLNSLAEILESQHNDAEAARIRSEISQYKLSSPLPAAATAPVPAAPPASMPVLAPTPASAASAPATTAP